MAIRRYMTVSVDGYVVGRRTASRSPWASGGFRLFDWLDRRDDPGPSDEVHAESMATRAVIAGRRTYEHAGRWQGDLTSPDDVEPAQRGRHLRYRVRRSSPTVAAASSSARGD